MKRKREWISPFVAVTPRTHEHPEEGCTCGFVPFDLLIVLAGLCVGPLLAVGLYSCRRQ